MILIRMNHLFKSNPNIQNSYDELFLFHVNE